MNELIVDLELLQQQQDAINQVMKEGDALEGLNNFFDTIKDIAEEHDIDKEIKFVFIE